MTAESQSADPLLGRLLAGKFRVERALGQGAMGKVYLAEQTNLGKQVALKVLHANLAGDPSLEKRFQREARAASMLSHPNIVQTVDFGNDSGLLFIAMELLGGRDLRLAIRDEWPFSVERTAHIVGQILGALDEAHSKGLVHRDLKPENVMLVDVRGEPDFVKVCDFGIAKVQSERDGEGSAITSAGMVCGTPEYMSPEQGRGDPLDGRSDLYSVAVILYHIVARELPFRAESALGVVTKHLMETPIAPSKKRPGIQVPPALEAVILRGLEKEREKRFATADEMKQALYDACGLPRPRSSSSSPGFQRDRSDAAMAATGVATPAPGSARLARAGRARTGRAAWLLGVVMLVLVLGVGGWVWFRGGKKDASREPELVFADNSPARAAESPAAKAMPAAPAVIAPAPPPVRATSPGHDKSSTVADAEHHRAHRAKAVAHNTSKLAAPAESVVAAPKAPASAPHTFASVFAEGEASFKSGDIPQAIARYEEAARLNPKDARAQRQIGKCYTRLGQRDRAVPHFRKYLEMAPEAPDAPFIRALVEGSN